MTTATTSQTIAQLEARLAQLDADRARTQTDLDAARTELAAAHKAAQLADREPAAQAQLERLAPTLHARLAKAPQNSPTVRAIRDRLPNLADANWSAADRLDMVRRLLDDLKNLDILDKNIWTSLEGAARKRNL
jgi:septal ring factor EnvC (AmiA/AmiB activator)